MRPARLHVLAGSPDLLAAARLAPADLAGLVGARVRPATAFWLAPGHDYHDVLFEDRVPEAGPDRRVAVFARSLAENFGQRFEPLVVLPDLLGGEGPARDRAVAVLAGIWRHRPAETLLLHGLALPEAAFGGDGWEQEGALLARALDGRLAGLRAALAAAGAGGGDDADIASAVTEIRPEHPAFPALLRNGLAARVAARAAGRLAEAGLAADGPRLGAALARLLADWDRAGLVPVRPIGAADFEAIAARLTEALLMRGVAADG